MEFVRDVTNPGRVRYQAERERDLEQRRIVTGANVSARILTIGVFFIFAVLAGKIFTTSSLLKIGSVEVSLGYSWVPLVGLTFAHIFNSVFLAKRMEAFVYCLPTAVQLHDVYAEVTSGSNPFVHGMVSRAMPRKEGGWWHPMSLADPAAWVAYAAAVLTFITMLPWTSAGGGLHWVLGYPFWALSVLSLLVTLVNWWAASVWMIALSRLHLRAAHLRMLPDGPLNQTEFKMIQIMAMGELDLVTVYWRDNLFRRLIDNPVPQTSEQGAESEESIQRIGLSYMAFRSRYPELDLPSDPWFLNNLPGRLDEAQMRYYWPTTWEFRNKKLTWLSRDWWWGLCS